MLYAFPEFGLQCERHLRLVAVGVAFFLVMLAFRRFLSTAVSAAAHYKPSKDALVKLRKKTLGLSLAQCREALVEAEGNETAALEILRQKAVAAGSKAAIKRADCAVTEGFWMVGKYPHQHHFLQVIEMPL